MRVSSASPRLAATLLLFGLLMAGAIIATLAVRGNFRTASREALQDTVEVAMDAVREDLSESLGHLHGIQALFNASGVVGRREFDVFVTIFLDQSEGTQALEWIPRVTHDEREEYEARIRAEGFKDFAIHPPGDRGEYFPVTYVSPMDPNLTAFGFDLATEPNRLNALERARDTGKLVATAPITLVQETASQKGFLIYAPIYRDAEVPGTIEERRASLLGFGLAVFRVDDFVLGAVPATAFSQFNLEILDVAPETIVIIHSNLAAHEGLSPESGLTVTRELEMAGRAWTLNFSAPAGYGVSAFERNLWLAVLAVGALLALSLAGSFNVIMGARQRALTLAERMTRSLAESEAQRAQMFELSVELIITADREGRFAFVSGAARRILGREPGEMVGQPYLDFIHPEDRDLARAAAADVYAGEVLPALDIRFLRADGTTVILNWNMAILPAPHDLILAVGRDLTEERAAETAKADFVSMVSHELRSPLTSIRGRLELLLDGAAGEMPEQALAMVEAAAGSSLRLQRLIDMLLDLSRIDAGMFEVDLEAVDLAAVTRRAAESVSTGHRDRTIELSLNLPDGLPPVYADPERLGQVITNVLVNAYSYTPDGGRIAVSAEVEDGAARLAIKDSGVGIHPDDHERVFERFFRAEQIGPRPPGSTGLGLAIARSLMELQRGEIRLESAPGEGSTFTLVLDLFRRDSEPGTGEQTSRSSRASRTGNRTP